MKGYKISKNERVILKKEEIEALDNFKNGITIIGFISKEHLNLANLNKPYVMNTGNAKDIYFMFADSLKEKGLIAIAKMVLRGKEHLAVIYNLENSNYLMIQELLPNKEITQKETEVKYDVSMKEMMKMIITQLTLESYNANNYKNEYVENVKKLIEQKYTTGEDIKMVEIAETTKPKDLKQALEEMSKIVV